MKTLLIHEDTCLSLTYNDGDDNSFFVTLGITVDDRVAEVEEVINSCTS